jgi:hypothetical protein
MREAFYERPSRGRELRKMALESGRMLCLTHCYTGYPMVRQARALVREGAIGSVRLIEAELSAGDPGVVAEPKDSSQRHWRFRKSSMGPGKTLGKLRCSGQRPGFVVSDLWRERFANKVSGATGRALVETDW